METVGKGEIDFAALGVDPDAEVTLKRKPSLRDTPEQPSEGIRKNGATMAVTICNLCGEGYRFGEPHACRQPSEGIGELIERLMIANMKLWAVCDKKANAANMTQEDLRVLVADDLNLCKSRAAIRAEINRRLGSDSGETVKHYAEAEES